MRTKFSEDELNAWQRMIEELGEALTLSEQLWLSVSEPWELAVIRDQIKGWRSIARGEPLWVLDILCANLQEANCPVSPKLYQLLQKIDTHFGDDASTRNGFEPYLWQVLEPQVIGSD